MIWLGETTPPFDERTREYIFTCGFRMSEYDYIAWRKNLISKAEERVRQSNFENEMLAIRCNEYINEMATCQSPSIALSRLHHRGIL